MALTQDEIAQLNQLLESSEDVSEQEVIQVLNASLEGDEFVRQSSLTEDEIPDSFFKQFNPQDIVRNRRQVVTQGVWSGGKGTLRYTDMFNFTDQTNEESGDYFWEVYDSDPTLNLEASRIQFYIAYGHINGGGSAKITTQQPNALETSKAIYSQHKNLLKDPTELNSDFFNSEGTSFYVPDPSKSHDVFTDGSGNTSDDIDVKNDDKFEITATTPSYISSATLDPDSDDPRGDSANTVVVQAIDGSGNFLGQARVSEYLSNTDEIKLESSISGLSNADGSGLVIRTYEDAKLIEIEGEDNFYAIHLDRSRYKQKFDPGNWELRLFFPGAKDANFNEGGGGYQGPNYSSSGSQGRYETSDQGFNADAVGNYSVLKLVDEAAETDFNNEQLSVGTVGREFRVFSGSLNLDRNNTNTPDVVDPEEYGDLGNIPQRPYGLFYPDIGLVLLDSKMLQYHALFVNKDGPSRNVLSAGLDEVEDDFEYEDLTAAVNNGDDDEYTQEYFTSQVDLAAKIGEEIVNGNEALDPTIRQEEQIKPVTKRDGEYQNHGLAYKAVKRGGYFVGRSAEEIISSTYFVRAKNRDFNFSNNPTFADRSNGKIRNEEFIGDPKVFITTVGLYDDQNNLVAVGKLSNPVLKDFQNEALIRVKLDY